jgi:hypothetical protein
MSRKEALNTVISINGEWNYQLDPEDKGISEKWYDTVISNTGFKLPGTTNENCVGEKLKMEPILSKETVNCLREHYKYTGAAWYQRQITIPEEWQNKRVVLFLERIIFQSRVWIDGKEVGLCDSLSVPHEFDITDYVQPAATHILTIRIDNRDVQNISIYPHAYTDATQTIWNGIVGRLELQATDKVYLDNVRIFPDVAHQKIKIEVTTGNFTGSTTAVKLIAQAQSSNTSRKHHVPPVNFEYTVSGVKETFAFDYLLGKDTLLWDEFSPAVYELDLSLLASDQYLSNKRVSFGMKEFKVKGTQFTINGRKTFLRGTLDCCIYPLTGYPPTDVESWDKVFRVVKIYGLNHVRFHSWCPPEAAFISADHHGVYLQVEGPIWMDNWTIPVGTYPEHYTYLPEEAIRVVDIYGNHPSFCLYSNGNELNGDFKLLHDIIVRLKERDQRFVYTLSTNWDRPVDSADDFFAAQTVNGVGVRGQYFLDEMVDTTELDFAKGMSLRNIPVVSHEVGQYCVYPNIDAISKYTGILRPINLESTKNDLIEKKLIGDVPKFVKGSGKLALQLYKDEIESALRTPGFGGFQLLDLHDFPGQSTATVGILDPFWDSKGLVTPEEFRFFCNSIVPLLRMKKRIYSNTDTFTAEVEISNFGIDDLVNTVVEWKISDKREKEIFSGKFPAMNIPIGNGIKIGIINNLTLNNILEASQLKVSLFISGTNIENNWDIWVYPVNQAQKEETLIHKGNIVIVSKFDDNAKKHLEEGKSVLITPKNIDLANSFPGKFIPVFWSPVHFISQDPCGIYCHFDHPLFEKFPTEFYSSYQWKDLLDRSSSISLDILPNEFEPIVQVIPNYFNNHKLGNLFEANVGKGKLFVCSIDINSNLGARHAARQLRYAILSYLASDSFSPKYSLTTEQVKGMFNES